MIKVKDIQQHLHAYMEEYAGTGLFEISVSVSPKNEIKIYVDSMTGVDIDTCIDISRYMESRLDRDKEDFELTVSSAGLDQPLKVPAQYKKNEGREVKLTLKDGTAVKGTIIKAGEKEFTLKPTATKRSAKSKKQEANPAPEETAFAYEDVKEAKLIIKF